MKNRETSMPGSIEDQRTDYSARDSMLYALAVGFCSSGTERKELRYVFEKPALKTVPTMASTLLPLNIPAISGWDSGNALLARHRLELYRPLPAAAGLLANSRVIAVHREDPDVARVVVQSEVRLTKDDAALFVLASTFVVQDDGLFGGTKGKSDADYRVPSRGPDLCCTSATRLDQGLLFRLCAGRGLLWTSETKDKVPPLQNDCVYGIASRAILETICDYDHTLVTSFDAEFLAPLFPGETVTTEMWQERNIVSFRCSVKGNRNVTISIGRCILAT